MLNYMALRYLLGLGIMGTTPLIVIEQASANSINQSQQKGLDQGLTFEQLTIQEPDAAASRTLSPKAAPFAVLPLSAAQPEHAEFELNTSLKSSLRPAVNQLRLEGANAVWEDGDAPSPAVDEQGDLWQQRSPLTIPLPAISAPPEATHTNDSELADNAADSIPLEAVQQVDGEPPASETASDASLQEDQGEAAAPDDALTTPAERSEVFTQAAFLQQGDDTSARLRGGGIYVLSPSVFAGATVDLSTGEAFADTEATGLSLNELYLTASPAHLPELKFSVGLLDLTSYLDRNSFAKDSVTQFFNPVFQTNPALSTVNVSSRPGALVSWMPADELALTAVTYSSRKGLGDFALDSFAGEVGLYLGQAIVRGTYATSRDGGQGDGFEEIFTLARGNGQFGPLPDDREESFGLNAEVYIPELKLGIFGRYGWYTNVDLGASAQTYSLGVNGLDVFLPNDRLGLGYGRQLSNDSLRQASGATVPDVWELFYDTEVIDRLRIGVSLQQRNAWTETFLGVRLRYDLRWTNIVQEGQS